MSKIIRAEIPVEQKQFVSGNCHYLGIKGPAYFTKQDYDKAIEKLQENIKKGNIFLYAAKEMFEYLDEDLQQSLSNDPRIGIVKLFKNNKIIIESKPEYGCYKLFQKFQDNIKDNNATADIELFGNEEKEKDDLYKLNIIAITKFTFFVRKKVLVQYTPKITANDIVELNIPLMNKPDENGIYTSFNGYSYTKENLKDVLENNERIQELLKAGMLPFCIGNISPTEIKFENIAGRVVKWNLDKSIITIKVNKLNVHGKMLLSHIDLFGKELFAGWIFSGEFKSLPILSPSGSKKITNELDIKDVYGCQLIRVKPNEKINTSYEIASPKIILPK